MDLSQRFRQDTAKPVLATSPLPYVIWSTDLGVIMKELHKIPITPFANSLATQCTVWGKLLYVFYDLSLEEIAFNLSQRVKSRPSLIIGVTLDDPAGDKCFTARFWSKKRS